MSATIGSLFSGVGGLELGLEWAGLGPVIFQVEVDPFCRRVLAKHWPDATRFTDVTQLRAYPPVTVLCGGFPCQDVSSAGKRAGLGGRRSGLWYEFARVVSEVRPRFVVVENVASGAKRWLPQVRRDLCALGYRTRAYALSAADVGAPHLRRRVFVVADSERGELREQPGRGRRPRGRGTAVAAVAGSLGRVGHVPDADREGERARAEHAEVARASEPLGDAVRVDGSRPEGLTDEGRAGPGAGGWWSSEPAVGRVAHGVSGGVDGRKRRARLRALGNAVVPQCAEVIGRIVRAALDDGGGGGE